MIRDAYRFIIPLAGAGILLSVFSLHLFAAAFYILALFTAFFFRNPSRHIPNGKNLIVSPADGTVVRIVQAEDGEQCISIFLSIFNVHVNRSPISGTLKQLSYKRGKFKAAFNKEASRVNEQNILTIQGRDIQVTFSQIAGLIARRVVCWKKPGDSLQRGELVGLIRFGSRTDIILPEKVKITVRVGDKVHGGSSVLGEYV